MFVNRILHLFSLPVGLPTCREVSSLGPWDWSLYRSPCDSTPCSTPKFLPTTDAPRTKRTLYRSVSSPKCQRWEMQKEKKKKEIKKNRKMEKQKKGIGGLVLRFGERIFYSKTFREESENSEKKENQS